MHILMKIKYFTLITLLFATGTVIAQQQPSANQYFFNQYMVNPAMGGLEPGLILNGSFRKQFATTPGGPSTQSLTAEYRMGERAALGFNFINDKAGLLGVTRGFATFSYHLPLSATEQQLHFGVGLGFSDDHINQSELIGQPDAEIGRLNDEKAYIDGSFGFAYTTSLLNIQAAIPNMKQFIGEDELDNLATKALFYSAASYQFRFKPDTEESWSITPKVALRGYTRIDAIVDAGAEIGIVNDQLRFMGMYHSSKNASFGLGFHKPSGLAIQATYTAATSTVQSQLGGTFEIGLKVKLNKK